MAFAFLIVQTRKFAAFSHKSFAVSPESPDIIFIDVSSRCCSREKNPSSSLDIILSMCISTLKLEQPTSLSGVGVDGRCCNIMFISRYSIFHLSNWLIVPKILILYKGNFLSLLIYKVHSWFQDRNWNRHRDW